jgi:hypothetical protein
VAQGQEVRREWGQERERQLEQLWWAFQEAHEETKQRNDVF